MAVSFRESGDAEKHQPIQIRVRERVQTFEYATETKRKTTSWCVGGMYVSVYQQYSLPGFFFSTDCSDEQERYSSTYAETERVVNELGKGSGLSLLRFA